MKANKSNVVIFTLILLWFTVSPIVAFSIMGQRGLNAVIESDAKVALDSSREAAANNIGLYRQTLETGFTILSESVSAHDNRQDRREFLESYGREHTNINYVRLSNTQLHGEEEELSDSLVFDAMAEDEALVVGYSKAGFDLLAADFKIFKIFEPEENPEENPEEISVEEFTFTPLAERIIISESEHAAGAFNGFVPTIVVFSIVLSVIAGIISILTLRIFAERAERKLQKKRNQNQKEEYYENYENHENH
ncbi:MAG: hypothetical protein FWG83_03850 [Oscillospiraceae bacterium]|nr:hypothetical protein [Oscillospiraceae bacterium]